MSAAASMQQPGSHPGSASGTPGPVGTPQPLQQPMSNPSMLMQQQQQQQQQVQQQVQQQQQQQMQQQQQQLPRPPPLDPAKEKLITCIHEYLLANGAPKAAETLKIEMGPSFPNAKWVTSGNDSTGFLQSWWSLFFDLYCAAPERRTDPEMMPNPSQEAKYFHDYNMAQSNFPMMNGMPPQFAGPGGMMGPEGMMPGFPGRGFPGGPRGGGPPVGHPMAPSPFMGYDPRMGGGRPPGMGAVPGGRPQQMTPGSFPVAAMRPPPPHMQGQQMPPQGMYRGPFMDNQAPPGSFPAPHGMGMNGAGGVMGMGSPGMQPMQHPGGGPPGYMMMPTSSAPMPPFGAMAPGVSSEGMTGPPSHPSQSAHTPLGNGPASAGIPGTSAGAPLSAGNAGMGGGMMNGEMKNSPHTPRGNGGTPGAHGGPGSGAPGSVHSGGAGSVPPPGGDGITPKQEPMDTNHMEGESDKSEVEKIKASLISDFNTKDEITTDQYGY